MQGRSPLHAATGRYSVEQFFMRSVLRVQDWGGGWMLGLPDGRVCLIMFASLVLSCLAMLYMDYRNTDMSVIISLCITLIP